MDPFIEKYFSVLQNIEFLVCHFYRTHPDLTDFAVDRVYEALIDTYKAEKIGRSPRDWHPRGYEEELFENLKACCDYWLGRETKEGPGERMDPPIEVLDADAMIACLKRLRKSLRMWNKQFGAQGYLRYVYQFMEPIMGE